MANDSDFEDDALLDDDQQTGTPVSPPSEVRHLRQRIKELELQLRRQQQATTLLESQLEKLRDTLSFRLGYLLIHGPKSWTNLRRLPRELLELQRDAKQRRLARRAPAGSGSLRAWRLPEQFAEDTFRLFVTDGMAAALRMVDAQATSDKERVAALVRLVKALESTDANNALNLAEKAYRLDPQPARGRWLAFVQFKAGQIRAPAALLAELPPNPLSKPAELARIREIQGLARLRAQLPSVPERARQAYDPLPNRSLYVTASSLPFTVSGYTVRSHALIGAIGRAGYRVTAALRPGYPADRGILVAEASHQHDDVVYHHSPGPNAREQSPEAYTESAARALAELARRERVRLVHAASNHVNALPALVAARRLGIPFVYEVRGMWELTTATRRNDWEQSERFQLERDLETLVAREADQVVTLTGGLAADLAARGVARDRIAIVPNSVDPTTFAPRAKDVELLKRLGVATEAFSLVYAGSLLAYEGLDDALRALAQLCQEGIDARFLIAGDGEARAMLSDLAGALGIEARVHFLGRLEPSEVPRLWSLADAAAFPRKPFRVCELVSPLKPLEPMTMGIPVVVSDVAALREMVDDGRTGLVHRADDAQDLARQLRRLALQPELRRALGSAAREAILSERTWQVAGNRVAQLYRVLTPAPAQAEAAFSG